MPRIMPYRFSQIMCFLKSDMEVLKAAVDRLKALPFEPAAELEAHLPSILDRAFKGEL